MTSPAPAGSRSRFHADSGERHWELVITVCDRVREACPRLPGKQVVADWGIPDPAEATGEHEAREAVFWDALTMLSRRIDLLCALPDEKLRDPGLKASMNAMGVEEESSNGAEA